jgi:hypothetical protein
MGQNKVTFFEVRTFDDLVFTRRDFSGIDPAVAEWIIDSTPFRATVNFDTEFGDGTSASVVCGKTTYSTKGKDDEYKSFEVWYSDEEEPRGYETKEQITLEFLRRSFNKR